MLTEDGEDGGWISFCDCQPFLILFIKKADEGCNEQANRTAGAEGLNLNT